MIRIIGRNLWISVFTLTVCLSFYLYPGILYAQTGGGAAVEREELRNLFELPPPEESPDVSTDDRQLPGDGDYEDVDRDVGEQVILRKEEPHNFYEVFARESTSFPDNAFLTDRNPRSDFLSQTQFGVAYHPERSFLKNVSIRGSASLFRYAEFDSLDFNTFRISTNYFRSFQWDDWQLAAFARGGFERLEFATSEGTAERGEPFLKQLFLTFGVQRYFPISRWQFFYVGTSARLSSSTSVDGLGENTQDDPERDSYSGFIGYNYQYSRKVNLSSTYRITRSRYQFIRIPNDRRRDTTQNFSLSISYQLYQALNIGLNYNYSKNTSNSRVFEYDINTLGLNGNLTWRF